MSDWLEFLGGAEPPARTAGVLVVGDAPALIGKGREIAEARGCTLVVAAPEPGERMFHLGAGTTVRTPLHPDAVAGVMRESGVDVVLAAQEREAAFLLGRLAQRTGGGLVRCHDVTFDVDAGELVCRQAAYGGRLLCDVVPEGIGFVLLDVARLPEPFEDPTRSGTAL